MAETKTGSSAAVAEQTDDDSTLTFEEVQKVQLPQKELPFSSADEDEAEAPPAAEAPEPVAEPPAAEEPEFVSIRDAASQYGLDLSGYADDAAALAAVAEQVRRAQQLEELYRQTLATQAERERPPAQPQEKPKLWNPPDFNPGWLSQVEQDERGQIVPKYSAGGTPEIAAKVGAYRNYQQDQMLKFWQNPYQFLEPFIDERVGERAQKLMEDRLADYSGRQRAETFIERNSQWLFEHDDKGQPVAVGGQVKLSRDGQKFSEFLDQTKDWRGASQDQRENYALNMLNAWRIQNAPPAQSPAAASTEKKQQFLEKAAGFAPSHAATTNIRPDADGVTPAQNETLSLHEMLKQAFKEKGITDDDLRE